jgi:hypothetical protein
VDSALIVALVGVAAAILGSVVGGGMTGWLTLRVERERHERERARDAEREAAAVRGIARVTSARLGAALTLCATTLEQGVWWHPELEIPPPLPIEDRKLLASVMPVEQWVLLEKAEHAVATLQSVRRGVADQADQSLNEEARVVLKQAHQRFDAGQNAVKELAMR